MIKFLLGVLLGSLVTFYVIVPNDDYKQLYDESVGEAKGMIETAVEDLSAVLEEPMLDSEATNTAVEKVQEAMNNLQNLKE